VSIPDLRVILYDRAPMTLRDTFERMATDFAYEILALVLDTSVREVAESGRRQPRRARRPPQGHVVEAAADQVLHGDATEASIDPVTPSRGPVAADVTAKEDLAQEPVSRAEDVAPVIEAIPSAGPPEKRGLLDALDIALDQLTEHRRHVLLLRFGGTGETPLTQEETARRTGHSPSRLGHIQKKALANVRFFARPDFAHDLRELEHRVVDGGADVLEELSRIGRTASNHGQRRPWDSPAFYKRLLMALAPGLAVLKAEPGHLDVPAVV
jgi:hypothetical protein